MFHEAYINHTWLIYYMVDPVQIPGELIQSPEIPGRTVSRRWRSALVKNPDSSWRDSASWTAT